MSNFKKALKIFGLYLIVSLGFTACGGSSNKAETHKAGQLISSKQLATYQKNAVQIEGLESKYAVNVYKVVYETKNVGGQLIKASGLVSIPKKLASSKSPMLLFHHGTLYENKYAPTEFIRQDRAWVLPAYIGFISIAPDYIGYGESFGVLHPYSNKKVTASTSIDLLRATKTLLKNLKLKSNNQLFLGGYSQGGGTALASHKMIEEQFSTEFTVTATSAGAGAYALSQQLLEDTQTVLDNYETIQIKRPSNLGFVFKAMDEGYQLKMLKDIFQAEYVAVIDTIYNTPSHSATYIDSKLTHQASGFFKKEILEQLLNGEKESLLNAFKDNDVYDWSPKAPVRLYHGKNDDWVPFKHSQTAYDTMRARGVTNIELAECDAGQGRETNHANCFYPYLASSYAFFLRYANDL
jgi:predicted esterase